MSPNAANAPARRRILIVEDDAIVALDLENHLRRAGYAVSGIAHSAAQALESAAQSKPDLALMDIVIKGPMDGVDAATLLYERFGVPVVYLTAYSDRATVERIKQASAYGYLVKPLQRDQLRTTIEVALVRHEMECKLKHSERSVRAIMDAVPALVGYLDRDQRYVFANGAFERWFGLPPHEVVGRTLAQVLGSQAHAREVEPFARALRGETVTFEDHDVANDKRHVQVTFTPDRSRNEVRGVYVVVSDISQRVKEDLRRRNEELTTANARLREDVEAERKRIAHALHDQMGQDLTALRVHLGRVARRWGEDPALAAIVQQMRGVVDEAGSAMRRIISDLRPLALDDLGIAAAAREIIKSVEAASGIAIDLTVEGDLDQLSPARQTALYRMLQESLTNVVRHSEATEASVRLGVAAQQARLEVSDNGRGFEAHAQRRDDAYGLAGMQDRAAQLGGVAVIRSSPGNGAAVEISLPLQPRNSS
jgi:PAS domain S-box-containing protein